MIHAILRKESKKNGGYSCVIQGRTYTLSSPDFARQDTLRRSVPPKRITRGDTISRLMMESLRPDWPGEEPSSGIYTVGARGKADRDRWWARKMECAINHHRDLAERDLDGLQAYSLEIVSRVKQKMEKEKCYFCRARNEFANFLNQISSFVKLNYARVCAGLRKFSQFAQK